MSQEEEHKTAEELEQEENQPNGTEATVATSRVTDVLERESQPLREGDALDSPFGPLPVRSLAAIAVFVVIAVVVYLVAWALVGTLGLVLGWIPAAALGLLAAREFGRRAG